MNKRPIFHFTAPKNWLNDPNGLSHYKGEYHMFYQHNPENCYWGNMTWGHAKSKNLFDWEHLPHALIPGKDIEEDRDGCFSGSGFTVGGDLYLAYTGVVFEEHQYDEYGNKILTEEEKMISTQIFAKSSDGVNFEKLKNPMIEAPECGDASHFRDPKIWEKDGIWYMVVGTKYENKGKVVIYTSKDLKKWELKRELQREDMGFMWECPDIFELEDKHAMIFSPQGVGTEGQEHIAGYVMGNFDYESVDFDYGNFELLDYGFEYYAPQTLIDESGRRILIGWLVMHSPFQGENWSGMMTLPRVVEKNGDKLRFEVAKEFNSFRSNEEKFGSIKDTVIPTDNNVYDLELSFKTEKSKEIVFFEKDGKGLTLNFDSDSKTIKLDRKDVINGMEPLAKFGLERKTIPIEGEEIKLRVISDKNVAEMYINDGEMCMTALVNPNESQNNINFKGEFHNVSLHKLSK